MGFIGFIFRIIFYYILISFLFKTILFIFRIFTVKRANRPKKTVKEDYKYDNIFNTENVEDAEFREIPSANKGAKGKR